MTRSEKAKVANAELRQAKKALAKAIVKADDARWWAELVEQRAAVGVTFPWVEKWRAEKAQAEEDEKTARARVSKARRMKALAKLWEGARK